MYLLTVRIRAPLRQNRPNAADANRRRDVAIGFDCSALTIRHRRSASHPPLSFRGPSKAREPGIYIRGPWLWIPGSPLRGAPRNDTQCKTKAAATRGHGAHTLDSDRGAVSDCAPLPTLRWARHSGAERSEPPGIHPHRPWLWIPGSPLRGAPE